jgi:hypothetical protein
VGLAKVAPAVADRVAMDGGEGANATAGNQSHVTEPPMHERKRPAGGP